MNQPIQTEGGLSVFRVPCLDDNYTWLLRTDDGKVAVVDPAEVAPVVACLEANGLSKLDFILNTHHHADHVGGNMELKGKFGCTIVGPKADEERIPGIDVKLGDGDSFQVGGLEMKVYDTPGHTKGHITLYFPQASALFPGDTLFLLGCGRLFEGTPEQMWTSLSKIKDLPDQTRVYCAHEYTLSNARFAVHVDPSNEQLQARFKDIEAKRSANVPTVPGTMAEERATNPFLRPFAAEIRASLGVAAGAPDHEAFGAIRGAKDVFK